MIYFSIEGKHPLTRNAFTAYSQVRYSCDSLEVLTIGRWTYGSGGGSEAGGRVPVRRVTPGASHKVPKSQCVYWHWQQFVHEGSGTHCWNDFHLESYVLRAAVSAAQVFMWWKCKAKFLMVVEGQQLLPSLALIAGFLAIIRIVNINSYTVLSCSSHSSKIMLAILHVHKHKCMCLTVWELQPFWTSPKWVPWILTSLSLSLPAQPQQDHLILPSSH